MNDFKRRLAMEFVESQEYRESYAEGFSREYITAQIKLIRKQRNLSQAELGERIESNQGRVSVYEDKDYGRWNIDTLRRIATTLGGWLKVSIESYGTLVDEAGRFTAAGLLRPSFENDPAIRRWLEPDKDSEDDPFALTRRMITEWLSRDTEDLQPLCDWLQGIGLAGYSEGEDEYEWILWSLPTDDADHHARAELAHRLAKLIVEREIDVRPVGWRPEALLRNLFFLMANLGHAGKVQEAIDVAFRRECEQKALTGETRMVREVLSALRLAMERNQADRRWEGVWHEFVTRRNHPILPGTVQAGFDGLVRLQAAREDAKYWLQLAKAIKEVELGMYRDQRVAPGRKPDVIEDLKRHIGSIFDFWREPFAATYLLRAAHRVAWMPEAVAAWASAVFEREWEEAIQAAPQPLDGRLVISTLYDGSSYQRAWSDAIPGSGDAEVLAILDRAGARVRKDAILLAEDFAS